GRLPPQKHWLDQRSRATETLATARSRWCSWPNHREFSPFGQTGAVLACQQGERAMTQPITVVVPVYNGVTQLDFTGPHQFLSRAPDLHVRVASLDGQPVTADRLTFSNLEDLSAIKSRDVLLVPGGGGCLAAIENDVFLKEIARLGATARYLTSVCTGSLILGAAGFLTGRGAACHWGMVGIASGLWRYRRRGPHCEGRQHPLRGRRHGRHRFRAGTYRGAARRRYARVVQRGSPPCVRSPLPRLPPALCPAVRS